MFYESLGRIHATLMSLRHDERGQGTVEYVGVVLLVGLLLGAVASAASGHGGDLMKTIVNKVKSAIDGVAPGGVDPKKNG